jgi:signal transduction histidine kinase
LGLKEFDIPIREGDVFQKIVSSHRPVLIPDVANDPSFKQLDGLPLDHSWLGVPLITKDRVIGMLSLTRREAAAFTQEDIHLVLAFAGQAAVALENASLYDRITRFNEQLEQMVQERTEELNRAYRTLEKMDRNKSDFINVAAHELRTPLTVIKGYAQVLNSSPAIAKDDQLAPILAGVISGTERLHTIVNGMLDVARIDSKSLRLARRELSLPVLFKSLQNDYRAALQERNLTLEVENMDSLPNIYADPNLLGKALEQLLDNAIKYTPDGRNILVTARTVDPGDIGAVTQGQAIPEATQYVQITVADSGIGIDVEYHDLIFEKFFQTGEVALHSSGKIKFKGGGPGLGLAIAKGIVLAHGGRIWVESAGHDEANLPGSRFHICLPVGERMDSPAPEPRSESHSA